MPEKQYFTNIDGKYVKDAEARADLADLEDYVEGIAPVSLSVTENGTYTAPTGVFGYSPVTVNVPAVDNDPDLTYLPNSTPSNVIASAKNRTGIASYKSMLYVPLADINTDVTCYCVTKATYKTGENIMMCVPYRNYTGNNPSFYSPASGYYVECTVYDENTRVDGVTCDEFHVYTLAINGTTKKVRYYIDGVYLMEKTFSNSGANVVVGAGDTSAGSYAAATPVTKYIGAVSEFEDDETIIANQQAIMQKLGMV